MKKIALGLGVLLLLAIVLPAMAAPAEVVKDVSCNLLNVEKNIIPGTCRIVFLPNGDVNLVGKGQLNPLTDLFPAKAVKWNFANTGWEWCGNDWQEVITPSGQVSLTCKINF
jgi:hypothetical protein